MPKTITLRLPEEIYKTLEVEARSKGMELDQLVIEWLTGVVKAAKKDPLDDLIGSIESPLTDIAERHNHYISQAILEEIRR